MSDKLFRINLFGGYKKEDVQAYIASLEAELEKAQTQMNFGEKVQREEGAKAGSPEEGTQKTGSETAGEGVSGSKDASNAKMVRAEATTEGSGIALGEDIVIFQDTSEEAIVVPEDSPPMDSAQSPQGQPEKTAAEKETDHATGQQEELEEAKGELERVKKELQDTRAELEISSRLCEQSKLRLELALTEKERLTDEVEKFRKNQQSYERDYAAVKDILLNARLDAEIIMTKARKEAKELLDYTQRQIEEKKKESVETLMRHLVENHTGLQASKYYLEEQVKNIERTEKQIEELQTKMESFLEPDLDGEEQFVEE